MCKTGQIYRQIVENKQKGQKMFAWLVDPDKADEAYLKQHFELMDTNLPDYIFLGGSLMTQNLLDSCIKQLKKLTDIPIVIFPGSPNQIHPDADGILLLSLISGRNPDLLIGRHVEAAPLLKQLDLEVMPTGYMLIESGRLTTAAYMSHSNPIPRNKPEIAACTAMAGDLLGLRFIYLDAGSGAEYPVSTEMIAAVRKATDLPIIVGGGICNHHHLTAAYEAGADVVVMGNVFEKNQALLGKVLDQLNTQAS